MRIKDIITPKLSPTKKRFAINLITHSNEYKTAGEILIKHKSRDIQLLKSKSFLLGRSIELSLKAIILIQKNMSLKDIKEYYGHSISKMVKDIKFIDTISNEDIITLKLFDEKYYKKEYEYPISTGYKEYIKINTLESLATKIYKVTETLLNKTTSKL